MRRIPLFHRAQNAVLPALALATTVTGGARPHVEYDAGRGELRVDAHVWPIDRSGRVLLNFPRNANAVASMPFYRLALAAMGRDRPHRRNWSR